MPRKNSPATLTRWNAVKVSAPYRASANPDASWMCGKPHPDLIAAQRVSPGGRLLLAFELAEIRDYFVAGHITEGAQAEADGADRATPRKPAPPIEPATLDDAFAAYRVARKAEGSAVQGLEAIFQVEALRLIGEGRFEEAKAIVNAMPADTVMKVICIGALMKSGHDLTAYPLWEVEPIAYTAAHGAALATWMVAKNGEEAAASAMGQMLAPIVEDLVVRGDRDGLTALFERTPSPFYRACIADARDYRIARFVEANA